MGHEHEGRAAGAALLENEVHDGSPGRLVEVAGRLVRHQDGGVRRQSAGQGDPLLLAARQLRRIMAQPVAEADEPQFGRGPLEGVPAAREFERDGDVLERRHGRDEMEGLEHDADAGAAETGQGILVEPFDAGILDGHGPAFRPLQAGQHGQERRFARARRACEADRLARRDGEADTFQDMDSGCPPPQTYMDVVKRDRLLHSSVSLTGRRASALRSHDRRRGLYGMAKRRFHFFLPILVAALGLGLTEPEQALGRTLTVSAFGDSLSAGYQLPQDASFPAQLERALRADGFDVAVNNAAVSGDTASDGLERVDWSVADGTDLVIVELGANDMLRGIDPAITRKALDAIVARLRERKMDVLLAGMYAAPNLGADFSARFASIYSGLARQYGVPLYPFFLAGVVGKPELHLPDGLHPTREGVAVMVKGILPDVETALKAIQARG